MKMKLRKCSCGGTAEIVDGEPTELGAKMLREYGLIPSRTYKAVCSSCGKSTASFPYGDEVKADWNRLNPLPLRKYVRVVRCKDCKHRKERHYEESGEKPYIKYECKFTKYSMSDDGFCSFGARMIKDGDKNE
ncbi:hypothetical protein [Ruminococcus flavefaciens]|uniref:Uncharacterized protein n=1 Tax=Ruminococcus flavefaciens TaxID=1265 RepID=A0A315Y114_RUMFL|nr:hypothetical protein [Ruminococcus flavefaciens]PWJ13985.1 hypothetical protein IE37_00916 [Ruminococcus flavefaciens]SSA43576.1 hypothetical protein SAMN02910325_00916 [Ruminococcus flavefaciens]